MIITVDYAERDYPLAFYEEGITSANNPDFWYAIGMLKPRYPMPAIPTVIDIEPTYVVMYQWVGPEMTGKYITSNVLAFSDDYYFGPV